MLFVIDVATGSPFWAHWPGLALGTLVAFQAAPNFASGWFKLQYARGVVIAGALILVNLFTWTGYPWVIWPVGLLLVIELMRRMHADSI